MLEDDFDYSDEWREREAADRELLRDFEDGNE